MEKPPVKGAAGGSGRLPVRDQQFVTKHQFSGEMRSRQPCKISNLIAPCFAFDGIARQASFGALKSKRGADGAARESFGGGVDQVAGEKQNGAGHRSGLASGVSPCASELYTIRYGAEGQ
jgi:hypothetical protein